MPETTSGSHGTNFDRARILLACALVMGTWQAALLRVRASDTSSPAADSPSIDFAREIAPLLKSRCLGCHGLKKQEGALRLDSRERLLRGSANGPVVQVGDGSHGRLIELVAGTAADGLVMPPEGTRLNAQEVARLQTWIDQQLPWPADVVLDRTPEEIARDHWSFQPIRRPAAPAVRNAAWIKNSIDAFVLARLEAEQVEPSPEADRRTLIRRLSLDLLGLLPEPNEVEAFVADTSADAYELLVDRLLASPRYGERFARPWLDLCHYGDTDGYLTDQLRPVAWRYRQWLIEALNADMPYDQFTIEQLAGDLLPNATQRERMATGFLRNTLSNREGGADLEEFRVEQVVDRTAMVGTVWLGLTVGCARCHDHKYDPLTQREFYGLYSFFDCADEVNMDAPLPGEWEAHQARRAAYDRRRAELLAPQREAMDQLQHRWEERMLDAMRNPGREYIWDRQWEVLGLIWGGNLGEGQLEGCQIALLPWDQRTSDERDRLRDYFLSYGEIVDPARFQELKLAELRTQLAELKKELPPITRAPAMRATRTPRPAYVHVRGDFRVPGDPVRPTTPAFLPPLEGAADAAGPSRLDLARWFFRPEHPLTARVAVNRAWQEFFGQALVTSTDNFGLIGAPPSHPELLDWLADEFRAGGWHVKQLHRLIVTSATYRQSSHHRSELAARDPGNRWLARQSALRLSAEQVRDVTLGASSLLDARIGGPSVFPPQPESVAMEGFDNKWTPSAGADRYRRGLYTWLQRLSPFAQNVTFDAPSSTRICTRRERSNTPLQALTLLNDATFWEAAQALAVRLVAEEHSDFDRRLDRAYQICLARPPDAAERQRLQAFYLDRLANLQSDPTTAATLAGTLHAGTPAAEQAAWASLASILLNLHEFITRD